MDNYEIFKTQLIEKLQYFLDDDTTALVLTCLDAVSSNFEISHKETALSVIQCGMPEALKMFLAAKAVEKKAKSTLKFYKSVLSRFFISVNKPIKQITTADIRYYLFQCEQAGNKNPTLINVRHALSSLFEWCTLEGIVTSNPVRRIDAIKQEKSPRKSMKRIELEYLRNACNCLRDKAMVDFLYSTGVRVSEFCNARIDNIDWEQKAVLIEHGKGNVTRWTYLNPESEVSLRAYLAFRTDDSPYIFKPLKGPSDHMAPRTVQNALDRIIKASGRTFSVRITPHIFRHTIATVLLHNGMPVEQVQRFLGHANINTTMIYAEVRDDDVRRSHSMYAA